MLDKAFDPATLESHLYAASEAAGVFGPHGKGAPFTIAIPPPNVTGSLHIGHALNATLQDVLIRFRRMQGRAALWMPGTDHAGIATQMVVERQLAQTQQPTRRELGREAFVERIWQWKGESGGIITGQLRRLGASLDWPRERFTMDAGLSRAVIEVFVRLHREGLIYRDTRLVNWDPVFQTAISDLEVESREVKGRIWTLRYAIEGEDGLFIDVATTRPETMLGDTAVAVNPEDARYTALVGRHAFLPLTGRRIPIIADAYSDPEKGTGAVKITPAHDFNDHEVGRRHALPMLSVLDTEARITLDEIGPDLPAFVRGLAGQDRFAAREAMLEEFERLGVLVDSQPHVNQVPHGDRSGVPIEPRLTLQWYCDAKTLAQPAIAAVESGATQFVPRQYENLFFAWMRDIQPWCISRQLWWGHRIPAWYGPDGHLFVEADEAAAHAAALVHYGQPAALTRDEDVLDTWFSSAWWPFSTLGWPEETPLLARHYPTDVVVTAFDIIFFWVARMMMMGLHVTGEVPFRHVVIHGLVRDAKGQKMSKSKGNVLDPLELVESHGADALRFTLCALAAPGRDIKLDPQRMEGYRAFVTKLWNAARFLEMNGVRADAAWRRETAQGPLALWLLGKADAVVSEATAALDAFRFDDYAAALHGFTWNTYCDWFIEFAKPVLNGDDAALKTETQGVAQYVLGEVLRLLHPVMPFVTAELWAQLGYGEATGLVTAEWPEATPGLGDSGPIDVLIAAVTNIRAARAALNVPPGAVVPLRVSTSGGTAALAALRELAPQLCRMARVEPPVFVPDAAEGAGPGAATVALDVPLFLPLAGLIDLVAERTRLTKDRGRAEAERMKLDSKLANAGFIAKATTDIIAETTLRRDEAAETILRLDAAIARIA